jgi:predicted GNAT family acetyltransferase
MSDTAPAVQHDEAARSFRVVTEGAVSHADYVLEGGRMVCTHTYVPPQLRGRGLAEQVVRAMLLHARERGLRVEPACSYVAVFIERNQEFRDLVG